MSPAGERLAAKVGAVRALLIRRAVLAAGLWGSAVVGMALVAAWLLAGPGGWRQGSALPLGLDLAALVVVTLLALGVRAQLRRRLAEGPLARVLEESAGLRAGLVQGALELSRSVPGGLSEALAERAASEASGALEGPAPGVGGSLGTEVGGWVRRGWIAVAAVAAVLSLLALAAPARAARAWGGLSSPLRVLEEAVLSPISVSPGSVEVPRGSDVEVRVEATGRTTADLAWLVAGDVPRVETLVLHDGVGVKVFQSVSAAVEYQARTPDGASSDTFHLIPVDPLFLGDLRVQVEYPPHTGIPPEEHRGLVPPLNLPEGTRLVVEGRASRELSRAALVGADGAPAMELTVEGAGFGGVWTPARSGSYAWSFLDDAGGEPVSPLDPLVVLLVGDSTPEVSIPIPGRDTTLALSLRQPLVLEARDDHGLRRLELVAWRVTALGDPRERMVQALDLGGTRAALARPLLDLSGWELLPGDEVRYFAQAVDNAPRAQTGRSREYALRMPDASALRRGAEELLGEVAERLEELASEAQRNAEETRDLQRAAAARPSNGGRPGTPDAQGEMGFEEKEEVRKALEGQAELSSGVDSLRSELEALQRALEDAGQADPELRADLDELQRLLEQIAGERLSERLEDLAEELGRGDAREASRSLRELAEEQEGLRERLERSLERFRRAAVEQEFRATLGEAEDVARKERALADAMEEADRPELRVEQQAALEKDAGDVQARMDSLGKSLEQIGEAGAARGVEGAREQARQAQERMGEARERARRGEHAEAGEKADQAADRMEEAAAQLEQAQQRMAQQLARAALEALLRAADDALALARRQSQLRGAMVGAPSEALAGMRGDEASLVQGVRNLAQTLHASAEGILASNQALSAQMGRAMESLERTMQALESRRPAGPAPEMAAVQALDDLNQVALLALAGAEQMAGQRGEGGGETTEQLEELAQQQGDMVDRTGQLTPLQLGQQALREQLQALAEEQQSVADELEELSRQEDVEAEALGDLSRLAAEAEAVAEALARGRLTPETLERQERLFHRLLDAGRSLQKEEEDLSDERQSRTPGAFERGDVVPLGTERLGALRYGLPSAEELSGLPPAVRQLVLQYFERLNRGGGGGGSL
ncbi:MAG TPA: hypothetical protein VLH75_14540 [Longimicrobiales bacterium]|nr:hypothetical protein [Longimicrobiales bacterium]